MYKRLIINHYTNIHEITGFIYILALCDCLVFFFVLLEIFQSFGDVSIRVRPAKFDLWSALMAIEQWGFFSVLHLLWQGYQIIMVISVDPWHSHLLSSVWQWSYHYLFEDLGLLRWDSNTLPSACVANALTHCATTKGVLLYKCKN